MAFISTNIHHIIIILCLLFRRILFCLDVHNEAVKSMRYPPDAYRRELAQTGKTRQEDKTIEDIIKELEDDMDDL